MANHYASPYQTINLRHGAKPRGDVTFVFVVRFWIFGTNTEGFEKSRYETRSSGYAQMKPLPWTTIAGGRDG
ncbi:hypothetical protein KIN20_018688 [Parelaphostrongylus tenuis]|uniref:Uncharacterized protein n=1 Tax=Parelaphostrongylus tenuis TaxID=148309 RepID=A0AAD5MKC1_PARTN|nr:hypothetical protein KIN20_018688 [Parelaphostrongylus tenuis]